MQHEIDDYKALLKKERFMIGSIVMNCNPFTLGHRYLVKQASSQVDLLYLFVVEEDKSDFPFSDRFQMVKDGVVDLGNVKVLKSGQVVLSQQTFSGYFNKENLQGVNVDPSGDVKLFATQIAPALGINIRFVGDEPEDTVTRQYNDSMATILPLYGIDLKVIPRIRDETGYVSAGRVRRAIRNGDMDELKKLVPVTTLKYLLDIDHVKLREKLVSRGVLLVESHQANVGWNKLVFEGVVSGTTMKDWAIEALKLYFSSTVCNIFYSVFGSDGKWSKVATDGEMSGTVGHGLPVYGVRIFLRNSEFHVRYRICVIGYGWSEWVQDGIGVRSKHPINGVQVVIVT